MASLQLERGGLENELLRSQIRRLNAPGTPPPSPDVGDSGNPIVPGQGDSRAPLTLIDGVTVTPRKSEAQAQDVENEYGESSDFVGGVRLARDIDKPLKAAINNWLSQEYQKAIRMDPTGMFTGDYDDMIRLLGWLRGKSDRERR